LQIKIKQGVTLDYISELYDDICLKPPFGNKIDIQLPRKFINSDISVEFSFLQFIASWIRKEYSGDLILPVSEEELNLYFNQDFVYPTVVLSWEKNIYDINSSNIKKPLKKISQNYFERMEYLKHKSKNLNSIPIYSFDHDISKRGLTRYFYGTNNKLVTEETLDFNFYPVFEKIGEFYSRAFFKNSIRPCLSDFLAIIHELYMNTDQHARTDENGFNLYPNIRAVNLQFHKRQLKKQVKLYETNPGLVNFFESNIPLNDESQVYLFEISILDSGPGFVKRYSKIDDLHSISINEEVEIVKECLYRHNTSSQTIESMIKGKGLSRILRILNKKGLLRIKTGRIDVYRDLRNNPFEGSKESSDIELVDWVSSSTNYTINKACDGALLSIIYPLELEI
tara:strand:- start:6701 stop:7888 length:1188 start_codon:yes stop_codon:yes gene_type:complete